jgi:steroid delta-isomerase-like uncharacterized protein
MQRRRAIGIGIGAAMVGGAVAAGSRVDARAAQDATPAPGRLPDPLAAVVAAWAAHDPDAIAALYAEDATLSEAVIDGPLLAGRAAIRAWAAANFAGFPDLRLDPRGGFVSADGRTAALEWVYTGSYTGEIPGLGPGAGQTIAIPGVSVMEVDADGLIVRDTFYYDRATFAAQFGAA